MASNTSTTEVTANKEKLQLLVERVFDAPRELVWKAWTEPEHMLKWWGPRSWPATVSNMDVRPGGIWHYCMTGPEGEEAWGKGIYREVTPPERLVYVDGFSDAEGTMDEARQMLVTIDFADVGGKTKITNSAQFATAEDMEAVLAMGVVEGVTETWDRFEEHLQAIK